MCVHACVCVCARVCTCVPCLHLSSDEAGEQRLEQELVELEAGLELAKEELSVATRNLRAMIRAFKESRLLPQPGQFTGKTISPSPPPTHTHTHSQTLTNTQTNTH